MALGIDEREGVSNDGQETGSHSSPDPLLGSSAEDVLSNNLHTSDDDELSQSFKTLQSRPKVSSEMKGGKMVNGGTGRRSMKKLVMEIQVPAPERPWEYLRIPDEDVVEAILEAIEQPDSELWYRVAFEDGREAHISFDKLLSLRKGPAALEFFNNGDMRNTPFSNDIDHEGQYDLDDRSAMSSVPKKRLRLTFTSGGVGNKECNSFGSIEDDDLDYGTKRRKTNQSRKSHLTVAMSRNDHVLKGRREASIFLNAESSEDEIIGSRFSLRRSTRKSRPPYTRQSTKIENIVSADVKISKQRGSKRSSVDSEESEDGPWNRYENQNKGFYKAQKVKSKKTAKEGSRGRPRKSTRGLMRTRGGRTTSKSCSKDSSSSDKRPAPTRRSDRITKTTHSMRELGEDEEIFADNFDNSRGPQIVTIREIFKTFPIKSEFKAVHNEYCDVCNGYQKNSNKSTNPLVYCQGCSTSIHEACLGTRNAREHIVTKVADEEFVMQCRRCVGTATKKDFIAPQLDICQSCRMPGNACEAFSEKMTSKQEEKLREDNGGIDPITQVAPELLNNSAIVLFRCIDCRRGFHFEHLPPLSEDVSETVAVENIRDLRFAEYSQNWRCKECQYAPAKIKTLVAWRPSNIDNYIPNQPFDLVSDDDKEYLIKWETLSYFRCTWMPGAWVWGVTSHPTRAAFARRNGGFNSHPKMNQDDAIPEDFLRMEIILDVKYSSRLSIHTEEIDKARISEVEEVYVKFQGLGYDEVVWEYPPKPTEVERWHDFVTAYNEHIAGKYFKSPHAKMKEHIDEYRAMDFNKKILLENQPAYLVGGTMMEYQMEGLNWLLYNYHQGKSVVLADEMGLGKTIQVIAAIATLIEKPKCWPFLVVVPNSTCPNWRREIKKWAPTLRVVAYYGLRKARDMAMEFELYPNGSSEMRAHVVITSYDAPVDENSRSFFQRVKWAGLIVDEGQRLKNDKNLLYGALSALKVPFRVLLTGTPLQNNKRELFNLLQFLDSTMNAAQLDEKYANLTNEDLAHLHKLIRPFFLRRTKVQVLKFLPPMAQVIVPVTMSMVQKKLYRSILARNPELIRSIFAKDPTQLRLTERSGLNNILMQLRKVLCHPFIYSQAIEERTASQTVSHRNLVDASAKLQLLEIMLPKLHERGHRVLIFSQFLMQLDIIEDFLDDIGLAFERLDGTIGTLEKQKRIDAFNAPESTIFAFLLSTRAGGVGINLATADTIIIMDPDFNPHQDIQALSRAHRIGQKKKVLVFQLMTKDSAEEKIVQIGRKKMALDHVLIESMDIKDDAGVDLQSILQHGAQALFNNDDDNDIRYDSASVDKLLDRSQVENTEIGDDKSAESQFSYARIWANDIGTLTDNVSNSDSDVPAANSGLWAKILEQREADAAKEAAAEQQLFGRGRRMRQNVDYQSSNQGLEEMQNVDGDIDIFSTAAADSDPDDEYQAPDINSANSQAQSKKVRREANKDDQLPAEVRQVGPFRRANRAKPIQGPSPIESGQSKDDTHPLGHEGAENRYCYACEESHITGFCALKRGGIEHCGLCGIAHFSGVDNCANLKSEMQIRLMLDSLKTSTETRSDIELARTQLRVRIHELIQEKKQKRTSLKPSTENTAS